MNDTSPEVRRLYHEMLMRKSPEERLRMGFSMNRFVRRIVLSSIGDRDDWREQLFLRYYKNDFTPQERERILASIRSAAHRSGRG